MSDRVVGRAWAWAALLVAGQIATLAMIHAGPTVTYQHYPPPWRLASESPSWALVLFAIEVLVVGWGIAAWRPDVRGLARGLKGWRLTVAAAAFVLTSATMSRSIAAFGSELLFASLVQLVHLGALCLFAANLRHRSLEWLTGFFSRLLGTPDDHVVPESGGPERFVWIAAAWVTVVAFGLAVGSYQLHPHVPDEVANLLQARYLASGHLSFPLPPVPEAFNVDLMMYQPTRWFSVMPSAWPFLLAVASAIRLPWLLNPLLGGINVLLAARVLREIYPRRTVRIAVLLFAASPWNLFMAMNMMSHTVSLTVALLAAYAVARLRRDPRWRWAIAGGIAIGAVGLLRQLEGIAVGSVLVLWILGAPWTARRKLARLMAVGIAAIATAALVLPYNRYLTGSARMFPLTQYMDATYGPGRNDLGFGANRGLGWTGLDPLPGHGPIDVAVNADFNFFASNVELSGWATGSALVILLLLASGRARRADRWMLAAIAALVGVHSFYWFSGGPDFGARYWFLIIVPAIALAARGLDEVGAMADDSGAGGRERVFAGVSCLTVIALAVFVPWRAVDKYYHYRGMQPGVRQLAASAAMRDGVVLIRGRRYPDYASAVVYSALQSGDIGPVFAWDRGDDVRRRLVAAYRDRRFWVVEGPTVTSDGYQVIAGPLSGAELLARRDSLIPSP